MKVTVLVITTSPALFLPYPYLLQDQSSSIIHVRPHQGFWALPSLSENRLCSVGGICANFCYASMAARKFAEPWLDLLGSNINCLLISETIARVIRYRWLYAVASCTYVFLLQVMFLLLCAMDWLAVYFQTVISGARMILS